MLMAVLLHLLGTAAGPALHGWFQADPHHPGWSGQRQESQTPAHDETACVVCQASSAQALPAPSFLPLLAAAARPTAYAALALPRAAPGLIRVQARAPPALIA